MPKQVIISVIWTCSLCDQDTPEDGITLFELTGPRISRTYDLCKTCVEGESFTDFLAAGLPAKKAEGRLPCQYCDKSYAGVGGLAIHQSKAHNVTSNGTPKFVVDVMKRTDFACPECDFQAKAAQGLGSHRRKAHGIMGAKGQAKLRKE